MGTSYPTVASVNSSEDATGTSHSVALPSSIAAGDFLIMLFADRFQSTSALPTKPTGWTNFFAVELNAAQHSCFLVCYKVADGTEGATAAVTTVSGVPSVHETIRITNYQGTPEANTIATGSGNTIDCTSLTPSWGSDKDLWICVTGLVTNAAATLAAPTNYTDSTYNHHSTSAMAVCHARRELTATSDDPASVTTTGFPDWGTGLIALRGAESTVIPVFMHHYRRLRAV